MPPAISLIISTYEQPASLGQVLEGVQRQTTSPAAIFVSDDGSGAATRELVAEWKKKLPVPIQHIWQAHDGFRKTLILNKTIAAAHGDYVVFLDGDCVPHPRFMADHAALAEKGYWVQGRRCFVQEAFVPKFSANTSVFTSLLSGHITGWGKAIRWPISLVRRNTAQRGIIGCNMGIWREDLVAINGFDEAYTGWGAEDSDLGTRLYNAGRPRKFVYGRAVVFHLNHPAISRSFSPEASARLAETIRSRRTRCQRGLDQYPANGSKNS